MKFQFENLGLLDEGELELSDLTIICGENNTGKTYATYAIYGFLTIWRPILQSIIAKEVEKLIETNDSLTFDLHQMFQGKINQYLHKTKNIYIDQLYKVFATKEENFKNTELTISVDECIDISKIELKNSIKASKNGKILVTLEKNTGSTILNVLVNESEISTHASKNLSIFIADSMIDIVFSPYLFRPHISSAERTGTTIFRKELDFARTRMIEAIGTMDTKELRNPFNLIAKMEGGYPWPVRDNVDFVRQLEDIDKNVSEIVVENPEILKSFDKVLGGTYKVIRDIGLVFEAKRSKRYSMSEASSSIRALLDIGFYLRCKAEKNDLFIIDEPELNLHPKNQRAFARLMARLVNSGVKVFITTHSDYLVKEINTLIMLGKKSNHTKSIQEQYNYDDQELLEFNKVKLYMTGAISKKSEEKGKKTRKINTLIPAKITQEYGIEVKTFDETIDLMNEIQSNILYGGDL